MFASGRSWWQNRSRGYLAGGIYNTAGWMVNREQNRDAGEKTGMMKDLELDAVRVAAMIPALSITPIRDMRLLFDAHKTLLIGQ